MLEAGDSPIADIAAALGTDAETYRREAPGMSAFALEDGVVYHTYSAYARGLDGLWGMYQVARPRATRAQREPVRGYGRPARRRLVPPPRRVRQPVTRVERGATDLTAACAGPHGPVVAPRADLPRRRPAAHLRGFRRFQRRPAAAGRWSWQA
jgi:Bacterial protein of unknown function (DUF899)